MRGVLFAGLFLVTSAIPCVAQDRASVRAETDLAVISLGDRLTFTIEVVHSPGQTVEWPVISDSLGSFEILGESAGTPLVAEGRQTSSMHYVLAAFELGDLEIPAIEVAVADSGDSEAQWLRTEPMTVVVECVGFVESGDIRAVKAPLEIPRNWLLLIPWFLLAVGMAALGYWLYRRYRSREKVRDLGQKSAEPIRPPHEVAYEALDRLEEKRLLERGEIKQYFIEVSEIIRSYLEARYPIDALEMTSFEVLRELEAIGLEPEVLGLFPQFFDRADLVKFAKHRPVMELCHEMLPMARRLVDETRVVEHKQPSADSPIDRDGVESTIADSRVEVS